jgi:spore coat protein CotH
MFKKRDFIIILLLILLLATAVLIFISGRQQFKIGDVDAIIDNDSGIIFVSLPEGSPGIQKVYFNFPFKNNSVYIKKLSAGPTNYGEPEEIQVKSGESFDFEDYISHSIISIKSGKSSIEYDLWITTGDVPIITIETENEIPDEPKIDCTLNILSGQKLYNTARIASEIELVDVREDILKESYSLNIKENRITGDVPQILDFEISKRFRLSALYSDGSLLRQKLAWNIYKSLSNENIAPESRFIELYHNGEYKGVYLLSRRVDRDIFGIANYSRKEEEHSVIYEASNKRSDYSNGTEGFSQIEPDYESDDSYFKPLEELIDFISNADKDSFLEKVESIIDIDNLIDNHILFLLSGSSNELASNQYIYRGNENGDKFCFCPGSYYNYSFGIDENLSRISSREIFYPTRLYNRLYEDETYREKLKERWNYLRKEKITSEDIYELIDRDMLILRVIQERNFKKWPLAADSCKDDFNFIDEIKYIKEFVDERIEWLDDYINNPPLLKIGDTYAFINEKDNTIFCSLPENSATNQRITWEFSDDTELFIEPLNYGKYIKYMNDFELYDNTINNGRYTGDITIFVDSPEEAPKVVERIVKVKGWALNPELKGTTGVDKILVFDGSLRDKSSFLGEADYNLQRSDVAEYFSNESFKYSGFELEIDTHHLKDGIHEIYIYAYSSNYDYSVRIINVSIKNRNSKIFRLENTETIRLERDSYYDFKEFIFHGEMTIKNKIYEEKYDLFITTGDIPLILIKAESLITADIERAEADMKIIYNNPDEKNFINRTVFDFEGKIGIKWRGQSTLSTPKKQYSVETRDEYGEDKNVSLLGMPRESDWILSASYSDKTLIRMPLAFELSNKMGLYAPRTKFVEVFLYQPDKYINNYDYKGIYILTESIKRDKNRVDIQRLDSDDVDLISGGYIIEMTSKNLYNPHEIYIETLTYHYIIKYPNWKNITEKQKQWITDFMNEFEGVLYGDNFKDPENGYRKYIDVDSFIDFIIINELFKNKDVFGKSTFMSLDRDSKLKIGPIWDFDLSSGNNSTDPNAKNNIPELFSMPSNRICNRLFLDPYFVDKFIERWYELRDGTLSDNNIINTTDKMVMELSLEIKHRNFDRWRALGISAYTDPESSLKTHDEIVEQLKKWLLSRAKWIDDNIESLRTFPVNPERFDY